MLGSLRSNRRSRLEICMDILDVISDFESHLRTPVMYKANVTHCSIVESLDRLASKQMLEVSENKRVLKITMLGFDILRHYRHIKEKLV